MMDEASHGEIETIKHTSVGRTDGLSSEVVSRHLPQRSAGEVLPGLWVGNLMSVSHLGQLFVAKNPVDIGTCQSNDSRVTTITVISALSNPNLLKLTKSFIEKQRLQYGTTSTNINHVIIHLKDTVDSDLSSVLPDSLSAIDDALGHKIDDSTSSSRDESENKPAESDERHSTNEGKSLQTKVCLVHCAKGSSRSVAIIIAYLLSRHPHQFKTFDEALTHVRTVRPQATPNIGFALALRKFERDLRP